MAENFTTPPNNPAPIAQTNVVSAPDPQTHSPFWPVLIVFIALLAAHASYIGTDFNEKLQLKRALTEIAPSMPQAARLSKIAEDLGKDLVALAAANDQDAAKIVTEFNITTNRPGTATVMPAPAPAAK